MRDGQALPPQPLEGERLDAYEHRFNAWAKPPHSLYFDAIRSRCLRELPQAPDGWHYVKFALERRDGLTVHRWFRRPFDGPWSELRTPNAR